MSTFSVSWEITDIEADSPYKAALLMLQWLRDEDAWVFIVQNEETKEIFSVDTISEDLTVKEDEHKSVIINP